MRSKLRVFKTGFRKPDADEGGEIIWVAVKAKNRAAAMKRAHEIVKDRYKGRRLRVATPLMEVRNG